MAVKTVVTGVVPALALLLCACGDEVGECEDLLQGRDTVIVNGGIQYGGQAIMNTACAQGCHSSQAKGPSREGAPSGLDFDLRPIDPEGEQAIGTATSGDAGTVVELDPVAASGLRERQRRIFEERDRIWQQVKEGMMPPGGAFARFKSALSSIMNTDDTSPCSVSKQSYEPITEKSSQDVLRKWLACGAPIVETSSPVVETNGAPGSAGYQYPACGVTPGGNDSGTPTTITIETVHTRVFSQCVDCHSPDGVQAPDLSTPAKAYAVLVGDTAMKCNNKPYVMAGNPAQSYFYEILSQSKPGCGTPRMPPGGALSTAELKVVSDWITNGALPASGQKSAPLMTPLPGGLDGGVF